MKQCIKEPILEIHDAAHLLLESEAAHVAGNFALADNLIKKADNSQIWAWTNSIMGKQDPMASKCPQPDAPSYVNFNARLVPRMPPAGMKTEIIKRDGFHCRFCGIPVITPERRYAIRKLYPNSLKWGQSNRERHAAFWCMWLQFDHIVPNSRGGETSLENIVVTCAPCNFGRGHWTIQETGLLDPRLRPPTSRWQSLRLWNGLSKFSFNA